MYIRTPGSWGLLINPEVWLLVGGGTLVAGWLHFGSHALKEALKMAFAGSPMGKEVTRFFHQEEKLILLFSELAGQYRAKGLDGLNQVLISIPEAHIQMGIAILRQAMIHTPLSTSEAHEVPEIALELFHYQLQQDFALRQSPLVQSIQVLEQLAGYTPTMGLLGAMGVLVHHLYLQGTPHSTVAANALEFHMLAPKMAEAFSATLMGIALANLFLLPLAGRLKTWHQVYQHYQAFIEEGLLALASKTHPTHVRERLLRYLAHQESFHTHFQGLIKNQAKPQVASNKPTSDTAQTLRTVSFKHLPSYLTQGYRNPDELASIREKLYDWAETQQSQDASNTAETSPMTQLTQ
jgi:chemotaxis protein MotA